MSENNLKEINFYLARCSSKEAKRRFVNENGFYVVDILKIIKELGYDLEDLTPESEFVINYSIQKKITQGIYSTRSDDILITYKDLSEAFIDSLNNILSNFDETKFVFSIQWAEILE